MGIYKKLMCLNIKIEVVNVFGINQGFKCGLLKQCRYKQMVTVSHKNITI